MLRANTLKKGDQIDSLYIEAMTMEGKCLAKMPDGLVVFLKGGAPGDTVSAVITKVKSTFFEANIVATHKKSIHRADPFCLHFDICGGCSWQHVDYKTQLQYKQKHVQDSLERIGGFIAPQIEPILPCAHTTAYRNRLDFTFTHNQWIPHTGPESNIENQSGLGFHLPRRFDKVFDVQKCFLQADPSNAIRLMVKEAAHKAQIPFFDIKSRKGFLRTLTIRTTSSGEVMIILQVAYTKKEWIEIILNTLSKKFPQLTSIQYIINTKKNDTFYDLDTVVWKGKSYITEWMEKPDGKGKLEFRVGPKSFYQTNSEQAGKLYKIILEMAELKGNELVYDLYTGAGTIAHFVAGKARKVIGLEMVPASIEEAKINATINRIGNTDFYAGDIKDLLHASFYTLHGYPDVIITDPPRGGMHKKVCAAILDSEAQYIIYVSCNPATQARDIRLLSKHYRIDRIKPVDMFPHTNHVENVVLLELKSEFRPKR